MRTAPRTCPTTSTAAAPTGVTDDILGLPRHDPCGVRQLYRAGSRVGRSHIASVVDTLILANDDPLGAVVTDQVIAQEIARSVAALSAPA